MAKASWVVECAVSARDIYSSAPLFRNLTRHPGTNNLLQGTPPTVERRFSALCGPVTSGLNTRLFGVRLLATSNMMSWILAHI